MQQKVVGGIELRILEYPIRKEEERLIRQGTDLIETALHGNTLAHASDFLEKFSINQHYRWIAGVHNGSVEAVLAYSTEIFGGHSQGGIIYEFAGAYGHKHVGQIALYEFTRQQRESRLASNEFYAGVLATGNTNMLYALRDKGYMKAPFDLFIPSLSETKEDTREYPLMWNAHRKKKHRVSAHTAHHAAGVYLRQKYGTFLTKAMTERTRASIDETTRVNRDGSFVFLNPKY